MARGYSNDLRARAVALVEDGESRREAARVLGLGASTAIRWIERWETTGSVAALPGTGHSRSPLEAHRQWLLDLVAAEPDLTLEACLRRSSVAFAGHDVRAVPVVEPLHRSASAREKVARRGEAKAIRMSGTP
jgi:transposase